MVLQERVIRLVMLYCDVSISYPGLSASLEEKLSVSQLYQASHHFIYLTFLTVNAFASVPESLSVI